MWPSARRAAHAAGRLPLRRRSGSSSENEAELRAAMPLPAGVPLHSIDDLANLLDSSGLYHIGDAPVEEEEPGPWRPVTPKEDDGPPPLPARLASKHCATPFALGRLLACAARSVG